MYEKLLEGAYDLHVHTGPDIPQRSLDDFDYAERLLKIGMKGFGIKSHYFCTAERARLVKKLYPAINPIGAITLNNSVGGINPTAVEMAAKDGAKIVWMPTFDAENEIQYTFGQAGYDELPPWAQVQFDRRKQGKTQTGITILEEGKLKEPVHEVLDLIAENNLILATGHLSKTEIFALVSAARDHKVKKIVCTHPTFSSIAFTKEEQKELIDMGAYMEECFGCITPDYGITWEEIYEHIRYLGVEKVILSSDLGQKTNPFPDEGMITFVKNLVENGFTESEIKRMTVENTTYLAEG
jgi:hypothetical protein